ncbi:hypothetical protein [Telmatospirillum sp.]|uniref:glycoside hydrolase family 19 protein n=1 Tax=Telmatospirillum sp. TaxID=2079197 RepID=UPI002844EEB5|nr:hypothetical protein [Telmatospirillum sp.]MDR3435269.1 hypothetical protein [Telmatospirillum sp.]
MWNDEVMLPSGYVVVRRQPKFGGHSYFGVCSHNFFDRYFVVEALMPAKDDVFAMSGLRSLCADSCRPFMMSDSDVIDFVARKIEDNSLLILPAPRSPFVAITAEQLKKIFERAHLDYLRRLAGELNRDLAKYQLNTILRMAHFLAQVREEGGPALKAKEESLRYNKAALDTKSYYKNHPGESQADGYERDPKTKKISRPANEEAIANKIYGPDRDLGNTNVGDGWRYRGRGLFQVTGRYNYARITQRYRALYGDGGVDFENNPDLMMQFPHDVRSAISFWGLHGLARLADQGDRPTNVDSITKIINLHTDSYVKRREHFRVALNALR